jgi:hypothetical protein
MINHMVKLYIYIFHDLSIIHDIPWYPHWYSYYFHDIPIISHWYSYYTTIFPMLNPTFPNSQPRPGLQNKERMVPQLLALGRWTRMCCGWWGYH